MTYECYAKSLRILVPHVLPQIGTLNIDLNMRPYANLSCHGFQDEISSFNSKSFLKHWNVDRDELCTCAYDDKKNLL